MFWSAWLDTIQCRITTKLALLVHSLSTMECRTRWSRTWRETWSSSSSSR
jgi:hypothetical protein